jgi:hypothetical protein
MLVQLVACLRTVRTAAVRFPVRYLFKNVYNGLGEHNLFFVSSFIHIRDREKYTWLLNVNKVFLLQGICRMGPRFQEETQNQAETKHVNG